MKKIVREGNSMKQSSPDATGDTWVFIFILFFVIACYGHPPVAVPDGYAAQNGGTIGGGDAAPIIVSTASAFISAVNNNTPAVIIVQGRLDVSTVKIGSNKTIIGADTASGLYGGVIKVEGSNYIFQNLTIGPSGSDAMEISGATNVFIHKCEFFDSSDELCSIVRQADYVTVSWCKFYFNNPNSHSYAHLIGNGDDVTADRGKLHVTLHHNWYAEGVRGRMPRVRFGHVHIYNNYYNSVGNGYCIGIGYECHIRVENTHFEHINNAWADYGGTGNGEFGWAALKFEGCSQPTFMPNTFPVFTPPYAYTMDPVDNVKDLTTDPIYGAGNCLIAFADDTTPPVPDPMTWAEPPHSIGGADITMTATTAVDLSGVEYYFANLTDPTHDSGWQTSPTYIDTGLELNTMYTYQVKARDCSLNANETGWSDTASAATAAWTCTAPIPVDLTGDCQVNMDDFSLLAAQWTDDPATVELVVNGDFAADLSGWTLTPSAPTTITWDNSTALLARNDTTNPSNGNYLYQIIPVISGKQYKVDAQWKGDLLNGETGRNWAEVFVGFNPSAAFAGSIIYKKATDGGPNAEPMPWDWESVLLSPNTASSPADGIFTATDNYMTIAFNLGGRASVGPGYFYVDNVSVVEALPCPEVDLNDDCRLNLQDLAVFAVDWLTCNRDPASQCGL